MLHEYNRVVSTAYDTGNIPQENKIVERDAGLIERWKQGDDRAGAELIKHYAPFINKRVMQLARTNPKMDKQDLRSEAVIGFLEAMLRYDPSRGLQVSTYAGWWVKAKANEYLMANHGMVKTSTSGAAKSVFFKLGQIRRWLEKKQGSETREETMGYLAKSFGMEVNVFEAILSATQPETSLDAPMKAGEESSSSYLDMTPDMSPSAEDMLIEQDEMSLRRSWLQAAVVKLKDREKYIFEKRRMGNEGEQLTLEDLSNELGISRERVRQIEVKAFDKVQHSMKRMAQAHQAHDHA